MCPQLQVQSVSKEWSVSGGGNLECDELLLDHAEGSIPSWNGGGDKDEKRQAKEVKVMTEAGSCHIVLW